MLLIDWSGTLLAGAVALFLLAALRRFTISGLAGVAAFPLICLARGLAAPVVAVAAALSALVLWAHRANIKSFLGRQNPP
jgi:glycerol-3-phosphate acyltransferase PlsY